MSLRELTYFPGLNRTSRPKRTGGRKPLAAQANDGPSGTGQEPCDIRRTEQGSDRLAAPPVSESVAEVGHPAKSSRPSLIGPVLPLAKLCALRQAEVNPE